MTIVCAWCNKHLGEKPPYDDKSVTHGICPTCRDKALAELDDEEDAPRPRTRTDWGIDWTNVDRAYDERI